MEKLVKQAQQGNKDAFVQLIEENKLTMTRVAMTVLSNDEDVADAVAETVLCVVEKIGALRKPKFFKTWLIRILLNNCYAICRAQKREYPVEEIPENGYEQGVDFHMDIHDTLDELSENDKLMLTLYYVDDLSAREMAEILGVNQNTIKTRILRGKKRFIKAYESREEQRYETC